MICQICGDKPRTLMGEFRCNILGEWFCPVCAYWFERVTKQLIKRRQN